MLFFLAPVSVPVPLGPAPSSVLLLEPALVDWSGLLFFADFPFPVFPACESWLGCNISGYIHLDTISFILLLIPFSSVEALLAFVGDCQLLFSILLKSPSLGFGK